MADVMFNCMFCNESLIVDEGGIGLEVPCPYCLHKMEIPETAERVEDPASIIEVEAPDHSDETETEPSSPDESPVEGDAGLETPDLEDLSPDNAETVLALLGSLLDEAERLEEASPKKLPKRSEKPKGERGSVVLASDEKVIQAIEDLRSRIDHLQTAYHDADHKVDELSNENSELRTRIQHEEHEREDLAAKLVHYTQKIEVDAILNELENHTSEDVPRPSRLAVVPTARPKWSYPIFAGLLCLLALFLLVALYKVTIGSYAGQQSTGGKADPVMAKNILLGDSSYLDGIRMIAYEAQIVSAASLGVDVRKLNGAERCLVINITLQNTKRDKNVYLARLWEEARLNDDLGNRLKRLAYRVTRDGSEAADPVKVVLKPTEMVNTVIIFEAPVNSAKTFVMTCRPGFWIEAPDGYEPVTESPFSLTFNRTEIANTSSR